MIFKQVINNKILYFVTTMLFLIRQFRNCRNAFSKRMEELHYSRQVNILMNNQQADHLTLVVWEGRGLYRLPTSLDWTVREFFMRVYLKKQVYWYSFTINTENKLVKTYRRRILRRNLFVQFKTPNFKGCENEVICGCEECFSKWRDE